VGVFATLNFSIWKTYDKTEAPVLQCWNLIVSDAIAGLLSLQNISLLNARQLSDPDTIFTKPNDTYSYIRLLP
jgi:hypothetical protein